MHRANSLKAPTQAHRKRLSKTNAPFDLSALTGSNLAQVLLGIFEQLGRQFNLMPVVVKDLYDKYSAKITECFLKDWSGEVKTLFDELNNDVNDARNIITEKVSEPKRFKKDHQN